MTTTTGHGAPSSIRADVGDGSRPRDGEPSLGALFSAASKDLSALVKAEIELAKVEMAAEVKKAGIGAGFLGTAGVLSFVALLMLSTAAAEAIALVWPQWAGFLVVGGAYLLFAGLLGLGGARSLTAIKPPRRTIRTVQDDIEWAKHPTTPPPPSSADGSREVRVH